MSNGAVSGISLMLSLFGEDEDYSYPMTFVQVNVSSGSWNTAFNINGFATLKVNYESKFIIKVTKDNDVYRIYLQTIYRYAQATIYMLKGIGTYTFGKRKVSELEGEVVYNSLTDDNLHIKIL